MVPALVASASMGLAAGPAHAAGTTCDGVTAGTSLSDCGFETLSVGNGFAISPPAASWSYTFPAGVAGNGSPYTFFQAAPEGTQVGFVQIFGGLSQTVSGWRSGELYTLTMSVAQRMLGCTGPCQPEQFQVLLDDQVILDYTATSGTFSDVSTPPFTTSAGSHTLTIQGVNPFEAGDATAFVDALRLTSVPDVPTATADCKNGGWQTHRSASDAAFKNQGDCVSYVATGGRNEAAG